jgi:hypothetical protein
LKDSFLFGERVREPYFITVLVAAAVCKQAVAWEVPMSPSAGLLKHALVPFEKQPASRQFIFYSMQNGPFTLDAKPRPNQSRYLEILSGMSAEQKVQKMFELNRLGKDLCLAGLRSRHPGKDETEINKLPAYRVNRACRTISTSS